MTKSTTKSSTPERLPRAYEIFKINPREIEVNPDNIRDIDATEPSMIRLKKSIIENGLQQPLTIRTNDHEGATLPYVAADGNRRLVAVLEAIKEGHDIKSVDCRKKLRMSAEEELKAMFLLNDGEELNPIERAKGVAKFKDVYGYEFKEIAAILSESHTTIQNLYRLSQMPAKVKKAITSKLISATLALQISRKAKTAEEFVKQIEELTNSGPIEITEEDEGGEGGESAPKKATAKDAAKIVGETNLKKLVKELAIELDQYEDEGKANAIAVFKEFAEKAMTPPYELKDFLKVFGI